MQPLRSLTYFLEHQPMDRASVDKVFFLSKTLKILKSGKNYKLPNYVKNWMLENHFTKEQVEGFENYWQWGWQSNILWLFEI